MSVIRRFLADLLTFGLVRRMEEDHAIQQENLKRLERGQRREGPQRNPISDTVFPEHHGREGRQR